MIISKKELTCDIRTAVYLSETGFDIMRARKKGYKIKHISTGTQVLNETTSPETEWKNIANSIAEFLIYYKKSYLTVEILDGTGGQQTILLHMSNNFDDFDSDDGGVPLAV